MKFKIPVDYASAKFAWEEGLKISSLQDIPRAALWLERAVRLAGPDPRPSVSLAYTRLRSDDPNQWHLAFDTFKVLLDRHDDLSLWIGLILASKKLADVRRAAWALNELLSRYCIPEDPAFLQVADLIALESSNTGWRGMLSTGEVVIRGRGQLGNPLDQNKLQRVVGFVFSAGGGLSGWATRPSAQEVAPSLSLVDAAGIRRRLKFKKRMPPNEASPFTIMYPFSVSRTAIESLKPPFTFVSVSNVEILGSPIDPSAETAMPPLSASYIRSISRITPKRRKLAVIVPVYRGLVMTQNCLASLFQAAPSSAKIIVVDDAITESTLSEWLRKLSLAKRIHLCRHKQNRGFPAAVNTGLMAAKGRDILLLNSDTIIPKGAIEAMYRAVYSRPEFGSATPFSNEATILSYPDPQGGNPIPNLAQTNLLQNLASRANGNDAVEIPTGVGFCMFLRHDCVAATGLFRPEIFAQGYGEENDFCMRARHLGYRHVAAVGAYVAHVGSGSFGAAGHALSIRNVRILNQLYPGYDQVIENFIQERPLADARRRFDLARFKAKRSKHGATLLISHAYKGGVLRRTMTEMDSIRALGRRALLLIPHKPTEPNDVPFPWPAEITDAKAGDFPSLYFDLGNQRSSLIKILKEEGVDQVILHHSIGHHPLVRKLSNELKVPLDIIIHDYSSFCPRITLLSKSKKSDPLRYCGEPALRECVNCVERLGDETLEGIGPKVLIERSLQEFKSARNVIAPSDDASNRIRRHFSGIKATVVPWQDDSVSVTLFPPKTGNRRIVVIGGIGPPKGLEVLIECISDAKRRNLPLEFVVAGSSSDDQRILAAGDAYVTGEYDEGEAKKEIHRLNADLAFFPSIWPETWCYTLSEAWYAGLYAVSFDIGALGNRIRTTGRGIVLPLGLPTERINDILQSWMPNK